MKYAIVFEQVKWRHLPGILVLAYFTRKELWYLDCSQNVGNWVGWLDRLGRLRLLILKNQVPFDVNASADMAYAETERVYDAQFRGRHLIRRLVSLYSDQDIHQAFKKNLILKLQVLFYQQLQAESAQETLGETTRIKFIPEDPAPPWMEIWERFKTAVIVWQTLASVIWSFFMRRGHNRQQKHYEFAINIVAPVREFANNVRSVDFLLDGIKIRKDNTLFIPQAKITTEQRQQLVDKGLTMAEMARAPSLRTFLKVLKTSLTVLVSLPICPDWINRTAAYSIRDYWLWHDFLDRYQIEKFITYSDFGIRQAGRNILLNQAGVSTWNYSDSANSTETYFSPKQHVYSHQFWYYVFYDNMIFWCDRSVRFDQLHSPKIGRYLVTGCLWSEHIKLLKDGKIHSDLARGLSRAGYLREQRVVAVFDTTFGNRYLTTFKDGVAFVLGIEKMLEKYPDLFVVWKEKKNKAMRQSSVSGVFGDYGFEDEYERLNAHPRCHFAGSQTNASEVIALAELTISFPFTSTTIEALGSGAKAIYFDPQKKYLDSYYDQFPNLVAHGDDELNVLVDKLVYHTDEDEYKAYLEKHIKGEIDPYLDSQALTRFRELLSG